jgi:hypothetical protein
MQKLLVGAVDIGIHIVWLFANFVAFGGLFLILHEVLVHYRVMPPILSDWFMNLAGSILAPLSLFFVSLSIYLEKKVRTPPTQFSIVFTAPVMIGLSLVFGVVLIREGGLSMRFVDGLSALALGGAMMRLTGVPLKFPSEQRSDG